jgi:hypothetical protein
VWALVCYRRWLGADGAGDNRLGDMAKAVITDDAALAVQVVSRG